MSASVTIRIPPPPRLCHPNARTKSLQAKWAAVRRYRAVVSQFARVESFATLQCFPRWEAATVQIVVYLGHGRRASDPDNVIASLKPAFDGLQDAEVIANDRRLTILPPRFERDAAKPRVELIVTAQMDPAKLARNAGPVALADLPY